MSPRLGMAMGSRARLRAESWSAVAAARVSVVMARLSCWRSRGGGGEFGGGLDLTAGGVERGVVDEPGADRAECAA